ncbi:hypothetical protein [Primorskyibacter sp. S87]|uniref:hypothetical protein n=1 Tax=Primorskyibacter sp. S87 TaxID=3415126 RepID=UPI003C7A86A9
MALDSLGVQDPFEYLLLSYASEKDETKKRELALELCPYLVPRLKAIDVQHSAAVNVTVTIGGDPIQTIDATAKAIAAPSDQFLEGVKVQ